MQESVMQDYVTTGRALQDDWLKRHEEMRQSLRRVLDQPAPYTSPKYDFLRAVLQHVRGNSTWLVEHLRSKRPVSAVDREYLAQAIVGGSAKKSRRGRPINQDARSATMEARAFHSAWRRQNKIAGTRDHGKRADMKDIAVRFVIDQLGYPNPSMLLSFPNPSTLLSFHAEPRCAF
jgi:hypothetical protein